MIVFWRVIRDSADCNSACVWGTGTGEAGVWGGTGLERGMLIGWVFGMLRRFSVGVAGW